MPDLTVRAADATTTRVPSGTRGLTFAYPFLDTDRFVLFTVASVRGCFSRRFAGVRHFGLIIARLLGRTDDIAGDDRIGARARIINLGCGLVAGIASPFARRVEGGTLRRGGPSHEDMSGSVRTCHGLRQNEETRAQGESGDCEEARCDFGDRCVPSVVSWRLRAKATAAQFLRASDRPVPNAAIHRRCCPATDLSQKDSRQRCVRV